MRPAFLTGGDDAARAQMARAREGMTSLRYLLIGVHASLPAAPEETSLEDLERSPEGAGRLRHLIEMLLADCIDPAIRMLLELEEEEDPGEP